MLAARESNGRDESDRTCRRRCRFFSFQPLFHSRRRDRHLSCEPMNDSSLGQLILCGVPGKELDAASAEMFRRVQPGGFILFGRNIESAPQLRKLIDDLRDLSQIEPIITIDQEGGRVSRLRLIGSEPPDAHFELPKIDRTREELDRNELAVFRQFVGRGGSPNRPRAIEGNRPYLEEGIVDSMMICHGWYPSLVAEKTPASLSRRIITDLLRSEFGFDGLVMTDDLDMGAILNGYGLQDTIRLAIDAGNDLVMICHRIPEIENVRKILETLPRNQSDRALASVAKFKKQMQPPHEFSEAAFRKIDKEIWDLRVATLGEERAKQRSVEDGKRSPVETY